LLVEEEEVAMETMVQATALVMEEREGVETA
jgi:hypothetical protein